MKTKNVEKLVANFDDKTEYVIHIRNLKKSLNSGLVFKKFIEWLNLIKMFGYKPCIDMNTDLRKKAKIMLYLEKLWKTWENIEI